MNINFISKLTKIKKPNHYGVNYVIFTIQKGFGGSLAGNIGLLHDELNIFVIDFITSFNFTLLYFNMLVQVS